MVVLVQVSDREDPEVGRGSSQTQHRRVASDGVSVLRLRRAGVAYVPLGRGALSSALGFWYPPGVCRDGIRFPPGISGGL